MTFPMKKKAVSRVCTSIDIAFHPRVYAFYPTRVIRKLESNLCSEEKLVLKLFT